MFVCVCVAVWDVLTVCALHSYMLRAEHLDVALQAAQAAAERAGREVARLKAELAEVQCAVEAGDPAAATAAAAQVGTCCSPETLNPTA